jgi:hypothetical protein
VTKLKLAVTVGAAALLLLAAPACGGDDDGGGGDDGTAIDGGGGGGDGGGGGGIDGGGGGASSVRCSGDVCEGATPVCCLDQGSSCVATREECGGVANSCDGREDCPDSQVCCAGVDSELGTQCTATCVVVVCREPDDCLEAGDDCCLTGDFGICSNHCSN